MGNEVPEGQIKETKQLAIGTSRALRDLLGSPGASPRSEARPADTLVQVACSELLRKL